MALPPGWYPVGSYGAEVQLMTLVYVLVAVGAVAGGIAVWAATRRTSRATA